MVIPRKMITSARIIASMILALGAIYWYIDYDLKVKSLYYAKVWAIYLGPALISFAALRIAGLSQIKATVAAASAMILIILDFTIIKFRALDEYRPISYFEY